MEWKIFLTIPTNHVQQRPDQVSVQTPHEGAAPGGQGQHRHRASGQEPLQISASVSTTSSNIAYMSAPDQIPTILSLCPPARRWCCPGWRGPAPAPAWPRAPSGGSPRLCTGCRCSPAPGTWLQLATLLATAGYTIEDTHLNPSAPTSSGVSIMPPSSSSTRTFSSGTMSSSPRGGIVYLERDILDNEYYIQRRY